MFYFFYRIGRCDCIRISSLTTPLSAFTVCRNVNNNRCYRLCPCSIVNPLINPTQPIQPISNSVFDNITF